MTEAGAGLPALIDRAFAGEEVLIVRDGEPVAEIRPAAGVKAGAVGSHEWLFSRRAKAARGSPTSVELLDMIYEDGEL
jgi:antitoxin (DNA-binding transcriptional repressor) of toxin-antitoxin stability system